MPEEREGYRLFLHGHQIIDASASLCDHILLLFIFRLVCLPLSSSMHCNMISYSDTGISQTSPWSCEVKKLRLNVDRPSCRVDLSATR
jgi:hypothetical protein